MLEEKQVEKTLETIDEYVRSDTAIMRDLDEKDGKELSEKEIERLKREIDKTDEISNEEYEKIILDISNKNYEKIELNISKKSKISSQIIETINDGFNVSLLCGIFHTLLAFAIIVIISIPQNSSNPAKWLYCACVIYSVFIPVITAFLNFRLIFRAWKKNKIKINSSFSMGL